MDICQSIGLLTTQPVAVLAMTSVLSVICMIWLLAQPQRESDKVVRYHGLAAAIQFVTVATGLVVGSYFVAAVIVPCL